MHPLGQRMQPAPYNYDGTVGTPCRSPFLLLQYISPSLGPLSALLLGGLPSNGGGPRVTQLDRTDAVAEAPTSDNGKGHTSSAETTFNASQSCLQSLH